ncbi:MAG TPA: 3-dehydroquinate synthase [Bacteroidia bacterium]|nr:3-dehydroquinate synthase [Bacteroidia bacterium]
MHLINDYIVISDNGLEYLANLINSRDFTKIFVLADENTAVHCVPFLQGFNYELITIPVGEQHKTLATCEKIFDALIEKQANRKSVLINVGGGMIGDIGGFCAAVFQRGIYFVNVPTTLLAMVDAGVGGKLGVDYKGLKNYIGLFKEPLGVFIHPPFLQTLPERELKAGFAEMLKHALIYDMDHWLELQDFNPRRFKGWLTTSVSIKNEIVELDLHENNIRKLLNFGHTIGHAVESYFLQKGEPLLHGEAVAIGLLCECYLSQKKGFSEEELNHVQSCINKHFKLPKLPPDSYNQLLDYMRTDKKNTKNGIINFTLLEEIGEGTIDNHCTDEEIIEALDWYNNI